MCLITAVPRLTNSIQTNILQAPPNEDGNFGTGFIILTFYSLKVSSRTQPTHTNSCHNSSNKMYFVIVKAIGGLRCSPERKNKDNEPYRWKNRKGRRRIDAKHKIEYRSSRKDLAASARVTRTMRALYHFDALDINFEQKIEAGSNQGSSIQVKRQRVMPFVVSISVFGGLHSIA